MHGPTCIFWANLTSFSTQRLAFAACFSGRAAGLALPGGGPASAAELGAGLEVTPTQILFDLVWRAQPPAAHSYPAHARLFVL